MNSEPATFWQKAAVATFGVWALILPITAKIVIEKMEDVAEQVAVLSARLDAYILTNQQRMVLFEERQNFVLRTLENNGLIYTPLPKNGDQSRK